MSETAAIPERVKVSLSSYGVALATGVLEDLYGDIPWTREMVDDEILNRPPWFDALSAKMREMEEAA